MDPSEPVVDRALLDYMRGLTPLERIRLNDSMLRTAASLRRAAAIERTQPEERTRTDRSEPGARRA